MNFSSVEYLAEQNSLIKPCSDMQLDFGGIVKGFAADKIASILRENGHYAGYVNVGGSSMNLLKVNSLGISHPRKDGKIIDVNLFDLENLSVSTSGDYEKYHDYQGKRYSHIINPSTGYPTDTGICSATIICGDGAFADAITTALCLCSHTENKTDSELILLVKKFIQEYPTAAVFVVFNSGDGKEIITNKTEGEDFTLLDKDYSVVKI
jgi:thiamine biosynthesis lipoprotein ApbE